MSNGCKKCRLCLEEKLLIDFYKRKGAKDGYRTECKQCCNAKNRKWAKENNHYEKFNKRHPLYNVWAGMKARCLNKADAVYYRYGGRGIKVCKRWMKYQNFEDDMLESYSKGLELDRVDNGKGNAPNNCRWATPRQQSNNRRNNRKLKYNGRAMNISQWARLLGLKPNTISMRLNAYGWSVEKTLSTN